MTPEEKFMFDLEGYLLLRSILTVDEVAELNAVADRVYTEVYSDTGTKRTFNISKWSRAYQNLIDHPKIVPYLVELVGPKFRIDHDYCIFMRKGGTRGRLHGGSIDHITHRNADHWYKWRDGVMRNGLTASRLPVLAMAASAAFRGATRATSSGTCPMMSATSSAPRIMSRSLKPKRATPLSSRRRSSTERCRGRRITSVGPCSTSIAPVIRPGPRTTIVWKTMRILPNSRGGSWPRLRWGAGLLQ